jgi:hypothetical protein
VHLARQKGPLQIRWSTPGSWRSRSRAQMAGMGHSHRPLSHRHSGRNERTLIGRYPVVLFAFHRPDCGTSTDRPRGTRSPKEPWAGRVPVSPVRSISRGRGVARGQCPSQFQAGRPPPWQLPASSFGSGAAALQTDRCCDIALSEQLPVADPPTDQTHPNSEYNSGPKLQAHPRLTSADVTFGGPD